MQALADDHQVVAIDMRGYNKSDKPKGQKNYDMKFLIGDVLAVVKHFKQEKATIVLNRAKWLAAGEWAKRKGMKFRVINEDSIYQIK